MESPLGYHPSFAGFLTCSPESGWGTLLGGQFDWGGRLQKGNGGAQRFVQPDGNRAVSVNAETSLTARPTGRAVTKVGVSDPAVCAWKCRRSTDKSYPGDNRLISPKRPQRRGGLAPRCRLVTSGAEFGPKGSAVRRLKWHASWVQNVVRQFGPYLLRAKEI